ncbi:hypothetical protein [Ancylobacter aquaticus]|uniref:hypothetical protein n=1 Tax=Ancylobacter aquaticus TaxID=100 RepID=UPI0010450E44|nr:hypothetical protein [Ancylobacter aquaticus]
MDGSDPRAFARHESFLEAIISEAKRSDIGDDAALMPAIGTLDCECAHVAMPTFRDAFGVRGLSLSG